MISLDMQKLQAPLHQLEYALQLGNNAKIELFSNNWWPQKVSILSRWVKNRGGNSTIINSTILMIGPNIFQSDSKSTN